MPQQPNDDELLEAVRGAGWLLEHHAIRVLDEADCHPRAAWAFQDPDEPTKSRELDVWSYRQMHHDAVNMSIVSARFLVECKQSTNPYVGIGYDLPDWRFRENPIAHNLPKPSVQIPMEGKPNTFTTTPAWNYFGFHELAREHGDTNFRVTQLTRLDRGSGGVWTANNTGIFTSLVYPIAKALLASKKQTGGASPAGVGGAANRVGFVNFALHFPVVLISCPLYVVDAGEAEPTVEQRPWVTTLRELESANVKGTFQIDVVTESAFADYVAQRLTFAQGFADRIAEDPLMFTGESKPPRSG
jgi:hypothetical protein